MQFILSTEFPGTQVLGSHAWAVYRVLMFFFLEFIGKSLVPLFF